MNPHTASIQEVERVLERERELPTCQRCGDELGIYSMYRGASYCGRCVTVVRMRDGKGRR